MLLILTNSHDATAEYLEAQLKKHSVAFLRFDTDSSLDKTQVSYRDGVPILRVDGQSYQPELFGNVWYRRPERLKHEALDDSPEGRFIYGEWAEALEGFLAHIPKARWVNHPTSNVGASHKIEQLTMARSLGFAVPETLVTQDANDLQLFFARHEGQIIVKPMASGYVERSEGETDSLVYTNRVHIKHLQNLDDLPTNPTLFQRYINKRCDVRITVVDEDVHAVALTALEPDGSQRCDIRRNNMDDVKYEGTSLPDDVALRIRTLMAHYGLRFAAIDMAIAADGKWYFFEINPNGQWAWLDESGVVNIASSFIRVFCD
jgi:glutathione synthase/RimK-type ligase-like ATP-grasp enzyme